MSLLENLEKLMKTQEQHKKQKQIKKKTTVKETSSLPKQIKKEDNFLKRSTGKKKIFRIIKKKRSAV